MLTFYHSPNSRSTAIATLIAEMDIAHLIDTRIVTIPRIDGSGRRDPSNPHPEGKVPALDHDGHIITERGAVILHLTTLFPGTPMAPPVGTAAWGSLVTWLTWYQGVLEPVLILEKAGVGHPWMHAAIRGHAEAAARIRAALEKGPWLLGENYSAADLLVHSPYAWFKDATPDDLLIRDWVARCVERPARLRAIAADNQLMARLQAA